MPLPVLNYAALPTARDPFQSGLADAIQNGFKMRYMPDMMKEQLRQQQLANALAQVKAQYAPQMTEAELAYKQQMAPHLAAQTGLTNEQAKYFGPTAMSEIGLRGAQAALANQQIKQTQFNLMNPLLQQTGTAGQLGALAYMQQHPELFGNQENTPSIPQSIQLPTNMSLIPPGAFGGNNQPQVSSPAAASNLGNPNDLNPNNFADLLKQSITADIKGNIARGNLTQQQAKAYAYTKLPIAQKNQMLAQVSGMGIDPAEGGQLLAEGYTIKEIAQMNGLDPNNLPDPIYPSTMADQTRIKFRQQAVNELNTILPILNQALGPYSQRINDYSPKQIMQAISGKNPDAQAQFLAAKGLMPEMAALRTKALGGQVGIEAIREVQNASMGNLKNFQSLVTPEVYKKANEYMDQWINQGVNRANSIGLNWQKQFQQQQGMPVSTPGTTINPSSSLAPNIQKMAQDAIAKGADLMQVQARIQQMLGGGVQ